MFKVACKEVSAVIYQYDPCMIMVKHIASIQERWKSEIIVGRRVYYYIVMTSTLDSFFIIVMNGQASHINT